MSLIQCDDDCIYQKDGYCQLDAPTVITNHTGLGCVHYVKRTDAGRDAAIPPISDRSAPQRPV